MFPVMYVFIRLMPCIMVFLKILSPFSSIRLCNFGGLGFFFFSPEGFTRQAVRIPLIIL